MNRRTFYLLCLALLCACTFAAGARAADDERAALKERFKARYPVLAALKQAGKVGETYQGSTQTVKDEYLNQKTNPDDEKSPTIRAFLADENKDRARLYQLIAEETNTTADLVARRNAQRNFERAGPEEYLKPEGTDWVKKKDMK